MTITVVMMVMMIVSSESKMRCDNELDKKTRAQANFFFPSLVTNTAAYFISNATTDYKLQMPSRGNVCKLRCDGKDEFY